MFQTDSSTVAQFAAATTIALVFAATLLSGPALGLVPLDPGSEAGPGHGTATVSAVSIEYGEFRLSEGRFGTDVAYLRIPTAVVDVSSTTNRSRLVYRVRVPALGIDHTATERLAPGDTGRHHLRLRDRALDRQREPGTTYRAIVTVRVQSFTTDKTVTNETLRIGWGS